MKIKDIFKEVFIGVNLNNYQNETNTQEVFTFKKENIVYNSILYNDYGYNKFKNHIKYESLPNTEFSKIKVSNKISNKYFVTFNDIVITKKKPYKVFTDIITRNERIIATNNYIILRGIIDEFYAPFVTYYIENKGIKEYLKNNKRKNSELSIEDIENIEIPNISKKEQIDRYLEIETRINKILEYQDQIEEILNKEN